MLGKPVQVVFLKQGCGAKAHRFVLSIRWAVSQQVIELSAFCTDIIFLPENKLCCCVFSGYCFLVRLGAKGFDISVFWELVFCCFLLLLLICSGGLFPAEQCMLVDEEKLFCSLCYSFGLEIPGKPFWGQCHLAEASMWINRG